MSAESRQGPAGAAYLAVPGRVAELLHDLGRVAAVHGSLVLTDEPVIATPWAANVWYEPEALALRSISHAAELLRERSRCWAPYSFRLHRRTKLIVDALPHVSAKPIAFPAPLPRAPLGSFTLLEPNRMLASARCSSPFPNGAVRFVEDREGPPSRAYLKLWEALSLAQAWPRAGELCLDLGASPGGFTWALAELGARVIAVDKAPLAPRVAKRKHVTVLERSAFSLDPREVGPVDWFFSDVICYPKRLLGFVERWLAARAARNFVCTLKLQGRTDHETISRFAAIPGSRVLHLHHNRHELTWMKLG